MVRRGLLKMRWSELYAGTPGWHVENGQIFLPMLDNGRRVFLVHWAGFTHPDTFPYADLWRFYRDLPTGRPDFVAVNAPWFGQANFVKGPAMEPAEPGRSIGQLSNAGHLVATDSHRRHARRCCGSGPQGHGLRNAPPQDADRTGVSRRQSGRFSSFSEKIFVWS